MSELYAVAKGAQIPRNGIIMLLSDPNIGNLLQGTYVRVLLELQDHREDYLLARINGVQHGEAYSGFSQQVGQFTTVLLSLQLPESLTGINGQLYQLNSISNSPMTSEEFDRWVREANNEFPLPTVSELKEIADRIRPYTARRQQQQQQAAPPQQLQQQVLPQSTGALVMQPSVAARQVVSTDLNATRNRGEPRAAPSPRNERAGYADDDIPTRSQLHHQLLNELRDKNALFSANINELKTSALRLAERDLIDYLENVRNAISAKRSVCVVCMDQVASVIMLPCKHKVLCRLCAPSVSSCPCCRELAIELFEPVEI